MVYGKSFTGNGNPFGFVNGKFRYLPCRVTSFEQPKGRWAATQQDTPATAAIPAPNRLPATHSTNMETLVIRKPSSILVLPNASNIPAPVTGERLSIAKTVAVRRSKVYSTLFRKPGVAPERTEGSWRPPCRPAIL